MNLTARVERGAKGYNSASVCVPSESFQFHKRREWRRPIFADFALDATFAQDVGVPSHQQRWMETEELTFSAETLDGSRQREGAFAAQWLTSGEAHMSPEPARAPLGLAGRTRGT